MAAWLALLLLVVAGLVLMLRPDAGSIAGYDPSDFIGRYGIEKEWEPFLHGKKGIERYITNA